MRPTRRTLLRRSLGVSALLAAGTVGGLGRLLGAARAEDRRSAAPEAAGSRERRQAAVERGCTYLAGRIRSDGAFGDNKAVVALTALSTLALMSGGSSVGRGRHGLQVQSGVEFLLRLLETPAAAGAFVPDGFFHYNADSDSKMHGQGYASLALAVALGSADGRLSARLRPALRRAVRLMEQAQTITGGYGYDASPTTMHEGSVTVCVAQALRAARDAGLLVDDRVVQNGLRYLYNSQVNAPDRSDDGAFKYSQTQNQVSYALTAAALSSFFLFGKYADDPRRSIERGLRYMMRELESGPRAIERWYHYGQFYAAWCMWQKDGGDWGRTSWWGRWQALAYPDVLRRQLSDGSWDDDGGLGDRFRYGPVLATAFSVLTLAIPDEPLPIFQR